MNGPWIGLYEVKPFSGNDILFGAAGAYVNVVSFGQDAHDFEIRARAALTEYGFEVVSVADVGTIEEREQRGDLCQEIEQLACSLTEENPVLFDEFQAYEE